MPTTLQSPEHQALAAQARRTFAAFEPTRELADWPVLTLMLAGTGYYRYLVPAEFGGATPKVQVGAVCALREELAYFNAAADSVFAVQGLGSHPVVLAGTPEQKREHLPAIARGETLWGFGLTEPEAGSDVAALATTARRQGDRYVLDGQKRFISNAGVASHYTVFARTGEGSKGISAFIVPADAPGLTVKTELELLGEHPIGELELRGCVVPAGARLGNDGDGMRLALGTLDVFRTTVGAAAVGMARRALDEALKYAKGRKQFGAPLAELSPVQALLADSAVELDAARLLVHRAAAVKDEGADRVTYEAAVAKLFATEAAHRIIDRAVQIHGGNGVVRGFAVERLYRDIRALRIYEGASEVQRLVIARQLLAR